MTGSPDPTAAGLVYRQDGYCPICEAPVRFEADEAWFRDYLYCSSCGSLPRERGLALVLKRLLPHWRRLVIHESSPTDRGISNQLLREAPGYIATQFYPDLPTGTMVGSARNEDLERQTFADHAFDVVITLDVMEHVNKPDEAFREIARTLRPRGTYIFTVPTYKDKVESERRASYGPGGEIQNLAPPEYHGNPVNEAGSLVTFHYGYDLPELIHEWTGMDVEIHRFHDHHHGIIGEFTEVYAAVKNVGRAPGPGRAT